MYSIFGHIITRELNGNSIRSETLEKQILERKIQEYRKAAIETIQTDPENSITHLKHASHSGCPYSSFILGYLYLDKNIRNHAFVFIEGKYNLETGYINCTHQNYPILDISILKKFINPDSDEANYYLEMAAELNNPQAALCLTRIYYCLYLGCLDPITQHSIDSDTGKTFLSIAQYWSRRALVSPDELINRCMIDDLIYLGIQHPDYGCELLRNEIFISNLIAFINESPSNINLIINLIISNIQIATNFIEHCIFFNELDPHQKIIVIDEILENFPGLHGQLQAKLNCC